MKKSLHPQISAILAATAMVFGVALQARASTYALTELRPPHPDDHFLVVNAIDSHDVAVGSSSSYGFGDSALRWKGGSSTPELVVNSSSQYYSATSISRKNGYIVGSQTYGEHKTLLFNPDGSVSTLRALDKKYAPQEAGRDVDDKGQVVGSSYSASLGRTVPVVWKPGHNTATVLPTPSNVANGVATRIAADGWIIGYGYPDPNYGDPLPLIWKSGALQDIGGLAGLVVYPTGLNSQGVVVGWNSTGTAFTWQQGAVTILPGLKGSSFCWADAVNENNEVVGTCDSTHAMLWKGTKTIDLNTRLQPADIAAGWVVYEALDINDKGSILATARQGSSSETHYVLLRPLKD